MAAKKGNLISNKKIAAMVDADIPRREIAVFFGCAKSTIDRRMRKLGLKNLRTGPKPASRHPDWNGGITYRKGYRYIYMPEHPNAINSRYVAEHRLVVENKLGRYLYRCEVVHHIDGNKLNNAATNLQLFGSNSEHLKHELTGKTPAWTVDGKKRIQAGLEKAHQQLGRKNPPVFYVPKEPHTTTHPGELSDNKSPLAS